jgi:hypothetical protein
MKAKTVVLWSGALLVGAVAGFLLMHRMGGDTGTADRRANVPTLAASEVDPSRPDSIAARLVDRWLARFRSGETGRAMRLEDYRVTRLDLAESGGRTIVSATLAVKPARGSFDNWLAGSGGTVEDGWIRGKFTRFEMTRTADGYQLREVGPGPL